MIPDLRNRSLTPEGIDDLCGDVGKMFLTYDDLTRINTLLSGWRWIYRHVIRGHLDRVRTTTLLDVGCGGGDISRVLVEWANRDGLRLDTTGIDPDPRAIEYALQQPLLVGTRYFQATSQDFVNAGAQFDLVISNHMLHHLTDSELSDLFDDLKKLARKEVILSDLGRSAVSYFFFQHVISPFFRADTFIRKDGLTSIERAYTEQELRPLLPAGWTYQKKWFERHLVRYKPPKHL